MNRIRSACLIPFVMLVIGLRAEAEPATQPSGIPADLAAAYEKGDMAATRALMIERLRAHLGEAFPDLRLLGIQQPTRLSKLLGRRTVIFLAATDYKGSLEMAKQFRAAGWRYPGYDRLVTLVIDADVPLLRKELPSLDDAFLTDWPLPSYLAYCRVYPSLLFISAGGAFEGFQLGSPTEPVFVNPVDGAAR